MTESKLFEENNPPFELGKKFAEGHMAIVYEAQKNPDYLVKRASILIEDFKSPAKEARKNYSFEGFRYHYNNNLLDMKKHVGNFMPETQLVYGNDEEGKPVGWIITEKISKQDDEPLDKKLKALDEVMSALVDMYFNKYEKEGRDYGSGLKSVDMPDFLGSEGGEDLIYGHTKSNQEPKFYLPDIYPMFECGPIRLDKEIRDKIRSYGFENFPITMKKLADLEKLIPPDQQYKIKI